MKFAQEKYYLLIFSQLILLKLPPAKEKECQHFKKLLLFFISFTGCMNLKEH